MSIGAVHFAVPLWLYLLPLALLPLSPRLGAQPLASGATWLRHPDIAALAAATHAPRRASGGAAVWLRVAALALMLVALAQPRTPGTFIAEPAPGRELALVVDTSGSMLVRDYTVRNRQVSRLEVLQGVVTRFVRARAGDRFTLIAFGDEAATVVPLSDDGELVVAMLARLRTGAVGDDTALGDAVALALQQFSGDTARAPAVVVFSDGESNTGVLRPVEAVALARAADVPLYTVQIAGEIDPDPPAAATDEMRLDEMAAAAGGRSFRAASTRDLEAVVAAIDRLEAPEDAAPSGERLWRSWYHAPLAGAALLLALGGLSAARRPV